MDFIDPKLERRNRFLLFTGYCLVALAIGIATLVLLYQAYGFGIDRQGNITQTGLVFVSSQPSGANITLNGVPYKSRTNSRVTTTAGTYNLQISLSGYRQWQRQIVINGGDVQHFDYPFLFPSKLRTAPVEDLAADPSMATQSPDRRWVVVSEADKPGSFRLYDTKNPAKVVATDISLASDMFTNGDGDQTWTSVEWAADNRHVLIDHTFTTSGAVNHEYILLDRDTPSSSLNLSDSLNLAAGETVTLYNNRIDQMYVFDPSHKTLNRINLNDGSTVSALDNVLAYKTYGDNQILYVTDKAPTGKITSGQVSAVLQAGQKTITLRTLPAADSYLLNLAQYSGDWYVGVAATNDNGVYIYKNPQNAATSAVDAYPPAWRLLSIKNPSYLAFSANTQFLAAESGQDFVVYDFENTTQYRYHALEPIDQPQVHASWMDGDRLTYVSGGKVLVFDYDYRNRQSLQAASAAHVPFFAPNFSYTYSITAASGNKSAMTSTPLVVKQ